jgi:hypothetical protein
MWMVGMVVGVVVEAVEGVNSVVLHQTATGIECGGVRGPAQHQVH